MPVHSGNSPAERKRESRREPPRPISTTVDDACRITGLGRTKIYELISDGTLKTVRLGRRRLVIFESLEALLGDAA
jgi:excisionase family DNA binding protein